ncbi:MAG: indolepyruvate ferredoxin oxidoreductase [Spirochaetaceae bacterium]|jgi:indolepyruvate ferredoxin oxidoreductase alpha subunit|nr:indolepyruvate ferredoxin oxidoreductase [Spirochaetaceae bacterium]
MSEIDNANQNFQSADDAPLFLLGDEAAALAAIHAGLSAAYGYPGTPSTEILEWLIDRYEKGGGVPARWCSNEKTALEGALGVSFAGKRTLVTMKHVGLNVAADPYVNSALLGINGGLVLTVADDPGMHSSQDEQDSRFYAAFARAPCLEPRSAQEAYDMAREAFDVSERFHLPVILRLTTRIAHARARVTPRPPVPQNAARKPASKAEWILLPANARNNYAALIEKQKDLAAWSECHPANIMEDGEGGSAAITVITSGLGGNYYEENRDDFAAQRGKPRRLHIGTYPLPVEKIRRVCAETREIFVIEEGQPFIEEKLAGLLDTGKVIHGKLDGTLPSSGELDADIVRKGLGLPPLPVAGPLAGFTVPGRPPQLCQGCPHIDSYTVIKDFISGLDQAEYAVNADIGCYSLGAAGKIAVPESIVCMGASVGMARGAAEAGVKYAIAVIGDSTFLHSGIPSLIDAVAHNAPMTLVILDNTIVAMTGCQEPIVPSASLKNLILGTGVDSSHLVFLPARAAQREENLAAFRREMEYRGVSVVVFQRECLEAARKRKKTTPNTGGKGQGSGETERV